MTTDEPKQVVANAALTKWMESNDSVVEALTSQAGKPLQAAATIVTDCSADPASLLECQLADEIADQLLDELLETASHIGVTGEQLYGFIQRYAQASAQGLMRRLMARDRMTMHEVFLAIESDETE